MSEHGDEEDLGLDRRYEARELGAYDYIAGARYVSPIHAGADAIELVEAHEAAHRHLAECNFTDVLGRLLAIAAVSLESSLDPKDRQEILRTLREIHNQTIFTHEVVATYESFRLVAHSEWGADSYVKLRTKLPGAYENFLRAGERAFGDMSTVSYGGTGTGIIVRTAAIAAMNLSYDPQLVSIDRLADYRRFVRQNSPDDRFRKIIKVLDRRKNPHIVDELMAAYDDDGSPAEYQKLIFSKIRKVVPGIDFVRKPERPDCLLDSLTCLKESLARRGLNSSVLGDIGPAPDEEGPGRMSGRPVVPGLPANAPHDLSIFNQNYERIKLRDFVDLVSTFEAWPGHFYLHGIAEDWDEHSMIGVRAYADRGAIPPLEVQCEFGEWADAVSGSFVSRFPIKVRSKMLRAAHHFMTIGHPTFLLEDGSAEDMRDLVEQLAGGGPIGVEIMRLRGDSYGCAIIHVPKHNLNILWQCSFLSMKAFELIVLEGRDWFPLELSDDRQSEFIAISHLHLTGLIFGIVYGYVHTP